MAVCPQCGEFAPGYANVCYECGYDFQNSEPNTPPASYQRKKLRFAQSQLADFVLILALFIAYLGLLFSICATPFLAFQGNWAGVGTAIGAAFTSLIHIIVIDRVLYLEK